MVLASLGGMAGLVARAVETAQDDYPRSPSAIVWAAVGAAFGFVIGACIGNRRLAGRPAALMGGLAVGIIAGAFWGRERALAEYSFARQQLLQEQFPANFIDAEQGGLSERGYQSVGLQYGICLGVLAGTTGGWLWKHPGRASMIANLFPVVASCFVALAAITMNTGLCELSADELVRARKLWSEQQARAAPLEIPSTALP